MSSSTDPSNQNMGHIDAELRIGIGLVLVEISKSNVRSDVLTSGITGILENYSTTIKTQSIN